MLTRHRLEDAARGASEPALATALSLLQAAVVCVDPDGRIHACDGAVASVLGCPAERAVGARLDGVLIDPDGKLERSLAEAMGGAPVTARVRVTSDDGRERVLRLSASPLRGRRAVVGALAVLVDVTPEQEVSDRLARQAQLLASVGDAVVAVDERLVITVWNEAAERMYGWSAFEAVGRHVGDVLETELPGGGVEAVVRGLRDNGGFGGRIRQRARDGRELWVELGGRAVRDAGGHLVGLVLVNRDVTDRVEAEEARARAESDLRRAQRLDALGQLAAGVAHDFNNLLTAIQGYAELLARDVHAERAKQDAAEIVRAAERGAALTGQLLAFARIEPPARAPVDVCALVAGMEPLLRRTLEERVELQFCLAPAAPAVSADRGQLEQVLLNLAVNARDAMPDGGTLTVAVAATAEGVRLRVADTGTGMPPGVAARAFEPFFTTKERGRGTGLGLATVWGIVHDAGGTVELETREGGGTVVSVLLPAAD
ncbi:MAG: PAS domain S-box protein [Thermoleophilia bacterium]|nr:PAS domain S-box protein [Thermoleophilia bacterium]